MGASFEDLDVWKKACRLSVRLFSLLKDDRDFGLKNQMLRASVSLSSHLAEGNKRKRSSEFQNFLNMAQGSAAELRTQIHTSREVKILSHLEAEELMAEVKSISNMLRSLHRSLKKA